MPPTKSKTPITALIELDSIPLTVGPEFLAGITGHSVKRYKNLYFAGEGPRPVLKCGTKLRYPRATVLAYLQSMVEE